MLMGVRLGGMIVAVGLPGVMVGSTLGADGSGVLKLKCRDRVRYRCDRGFHRLASGDQE